MSLPEKLIKSAKAGNLREVRKMLGRNVQITKDKVGYYSRNNMHVKTSLCNQYTLYLAHISCARKDLLYEHSNYSLEILHFMKLRGMATVISSRYFSTHSALWTASTTLDLLPCTWPAKMATAKS